MVISTFMNYIMYLMIFNSTIYLSADFPVSIGFSSLRHCHNIYVHAHNLYIHSQYWMNLLIYTTFITDVLRATNLASHGVFRNTWLFLLKYDMVALGNNRFNQLLIFIIQITCKIRVVKIVHSEIRLLW